MQPFDDLLPVETERENEDLIAFLRRSHGLSVVTEAEPEPQQRELVLVSVRRRLQIIQQEYREENARKPPLRLLTPAETSEGMALPLPEKMFPTRKNGWRRGLALLAATLLAALVVGSLLTVFTLAKQNSQGKHGQKQNSQVNGATATQPQKLYIIEPGWLQKIDATSGTLIWKAQLPYKKSDTNWPSVFPLVGNGIVYTSVENKLLAFNATNGEQLWSVDINDGSVDAAAQLTQPIFYQGKLYFELQVSVKNSNRIWSIMEALDARSGSVLWHYNPSAVLIDDFVAANGIIYITFDKLVGHDKTQNELVALDSSTGIQKWSVATNAGHVPAIGIGNRDLVVENGLIYHLLSSSDCGGKNSNCIYAYNATSGSFLWHSQDLWPASASSIGRYLQFIGSLLFAGNILYSNSNTGLCAVDARNGQVLWRQSEGSNFILQPPGAKQLSQPYAGNGSSGNSFVVVGGSIYYMEMTNRGDYLARLDTSNGRMISKQRVEDFDTGLSGWEGINGKPFIGFKLFEGLMSNKISYVFPSVGHLDALSNQTGALLWSIKLASGPALLSLAP